MQAHAVGCLPIPVGLLDIYGQVGFDGWHLNGQGLSFVRRSEDSTSFAWGVGIQVRISLVGARSNSRSHQ